MRILKPWTSNYNDQAKQTVTIGTIFVLWMCQNLHQQLHTRTADGWFNRIGVHCAVGGLPGRVVVKAGIKRVMCRIRTYEDFLGQRVRNEVGNWRPTKMLFHKKAY